MRRVDLDEVMLSEWAVATWLTRCSDHVRLGLPLPAVVPDEEAVIQPGGALRILVEGTSLYLDVPPGQWAWRVLA